uniref:Reverse transcriptase domain-containing protein n=1 Tax=Bionectria ochroleuca TaxID=29856 RepID=A0A8H7N5M2_BIOOC
MSRRSTLRGSKALRSPRNPAPQVRRRTVRLGNETLDLLQLNMKDSIKRLYGLKQSLSEELSEPQPHVIAAQDIPKGFPFVPMPGYHLHYHSSRALTEDDNPDAVKTTVMKGKPKPRSKWRLDRVAFYVHESIPLADWGVTYHTEKSKGLVATLFLNTASGAVKIHNVYNQHKELDMDYLFSYCEICSSDILLGDFNLHGRRRSPRCGNAGDPTRCSDILTVKFKRQVLLHDRLDFCWQQHCPLVKSCQVIDDLAAFTSDHRPVLTRLKMGPNREVKARYSWNEVKGKTFLSTLKQTMSAIGFDSFGSISEADGYLGRVTGAMAAAMAQDVPIRQQAVRRSKPARASNDKFAITRESVLEKLKAGPNPRFRNFFKRQSQKRDRRQRRTEWRRFIATEAERVERGRQKIFQWSKLSKAWAQPKAMPHMPTLCSDKGERHTTNEAKALHFVETMWPDISKGEEAPPKLKMPQLPPDNPSKLEISKELRPGEVAALIKKLPNRKAEGPDQIANEAFKLALPVILPYLVHFFQACLDLDYHPKAFRHALTVVLPKAGKETYQRAKSWRPVALLSCLGKMLEKIVANRIKELLMSNPHLCPLLQFGSPGKSTTHALEYITNWVYRSWQRPPGGNADHTSLMALDISGAYDHVRREELLQRLVDKGFPDWLGSPLSPILFILFAAPILETFDNYKLKAGKGKKVRRRRGKGETTCVFSVISYVDDTNFLVSSPSFELNCAILTELHERLMEWATPRGVKFGPDKYALMHFQRRKPRKPETQPMPKIRGLIRKHLMKEELRILGVMYDRHLKWDKHIDELKAKVSKILGYHTRISGSTWGPTLIRMRQLHVSKIRSIVGYASPAWFIPRHNRHDLGLPQTWLNKLEVMQNDSLVKVAGAYKMTDRMVLRKELHVESMEHYLGRIALTYRMKNVGSAYLTALEKAQQGNINPMGKQQRTLQNPFTLMYSEAKRELLTVKAQFTKQNKNGEVVLGQTRHSGSILAVVKLIKAHATARCADRCAEEWDTYVMKKSNNRDKIPAAYLESWGPQSLSYYRHLGRAESTMLMQCRTETIGLNRWLNKMNSKKKTYSESDLCPCRKGPHTIEHLFMRCPRLTEKRRKLVAEVKEFRLQKLLTSDAKVASRWAILNFGLDQFAWPREELMVS